MFGALRYWMIGAAVGVAACGAADTHGRWHDTTVRPDQFALLPCDVDRVIPCTLVVAGGKRILFGAPAGAGHSMRPEDLRQLDAVMVFSLNASDTEGLDEVRNLSWHAGRPEPLLVIGPPGLEEMAEALNKAFEQADALYVVEHGHPAGGYDAAVLTARSASFGQRVFDTGDLQVERIPSGFRVIYDATQVVELYDCSKVPEMEEEPSEFEVSTRLVCTASAAAQSWPVSMPIFVK